MESFLEERKSKLAAKSYKNLECFCNKYKDIFDLQEEQIIEFFSKFSDETKKKYLYNTLMIKKFRDEPFILIESECKKIKEIIEQNNKTKERILPEFKIKENLNKLDELYFILKTNLPALRSDLSTVKIKNYDEKLENYYKDGSIHFNTLVKVDGKLKLELPENVIDYINHYNFKNDFLLDFTSSDRNNYECSVLCKKVFGITINEYRKNYISKAFENKTEAKDILQTALDISKECNTSIQQLIDYYLC